MIEYIPLVTIIIPFHNRRELLVETLASVQKQTYTNWECILVDDHSTDGSLAIAEQYAKVDGRFRATILPEPKRYVSAARNYGLKIALGEFVAFLDSDDLFLPDKLQFQVNEFFRNPVLDVVTCQYATLNEDGLCYPKFANNQYWLDIAWAPDPKRYGCLWDTNAPLWRKTAILSIGAWNEELRAWHDVELNIRAMLSGLRIERIERVLHHVRVGGENKMSAPTIERADYLQKAVLIAWKELKEKNQETELRRKMISLRLYSIAHLIMTKGRIARGLKYWIAGSLATGQGTKRILCGLLLLVARRYYRLRSLRAPLKASFFSHLRNLPDGLSSS